MDCFIKLDKNDNVLIARRTIQKDEEYTVNGENYISKERIPLGFKIASTDIKKGDKILRYNVPIGSAIVDIPFREVVHIHNIKSDFIPTYTIQNQEDYEQK